MCSVLADFVGRGAGILRKESRFQSLGALRLLVAPNTYRDWTKSRDALKD